MARKKSQNRKKTAAVDLEDFRCTVDDLKTKLKNAKKQIRRRANFNPLWKI